MSTIPRFSLEEYDRMIQRGVFEEPHHRRIELIYGELREMSPPGPTHEEVIDLLNRWSMKHTDENNVRVRIQNSIGLPDWDSAPQPDVAWVKAKSYRDQRPSAEDVYLLIEVSETSLAYDRGEKAGLYARGGIGDYWIVNIPEFCVEVHRDPANETYQSIFRYDVTSAVSPLAFPEISLPIRDLFQPTR